MSATQEGFNLDHVRAQVNAAFAEALELARIHDPAKGPFEPLTPRGERRDMGYRETDDQRSLREHVGLIGEHPLLNAMLARAQTHRRTYERDPRFSKGGFPEPGSLNRKRTAKRWGKDS